MKAILWPIVATVMLGGVDVASAADLKDEVKIEIESVDAVTANEFPKPNAISWSGLRVVAGTAYRWWP